MSAVATLTLNPILALKALAQWGPGEDRIGLPHLGDRRGTGMWGAAMTQRREFRWEQERGALPSAWLEAHPEACDLLFAIRQYFYRWDPSNGRAFRARVGVRWLGDTRLCLGGKAGDQIRMEVIRRFKRVEAAMGLEKESNKL